jgi:hypothetical protein
MTVSLILLLTAIAQKSSGSGAGHKGQEKVTWAPPQIPITSKNEGWTKPKVMVAALRADGLSVELEQTDIKAASKRYGAIIGHEGDAGDFFQWLCFVGGREEQRWVLWLGSGEIDGDRVSDFSIKHIASDTEVDSRCRALSRSFEEPTTSPSTLRLGMSELELTLELGEPTVKAGDFLFYAHRHDLKLHNEPYTLMNTVTIEIKNGVVSAIRVWKSTQS